jgi:ABC-type glycerol-3-phosphate transport system substrate-binding protein
MRNHSSRRLVTIAAALSLTSTLVVGLAGPVGAQDEERLFLDVVSLRPGDSEEAFHAFDAQVTQFEEANPDIDIVAHEYNWTGPTFAAMLAGGTLPDVFTIPFTDGKSLIEQGQLANITELVEALPYGGSFNPNVLATAQDDEGHIYGLPRQGYGIGLQYNRQLFEQAGLDPDKPPTTWDEVRDAAKAIAEATGQAGYIQMTQSNTGGWQTTVATYARGGRMEEVAEDGTVTSTINNPATKEALEFLKALRWQDDSMGSNFLFDWGTSNQAFAAGQAGMYTQGADVYTALVQSQQIDPAIYGLTVIPLADDPNAGVLAGGDIAAVNVKASPEEQAAAVRWIDFYYMQKLLDQEAAVRDAETLAADGQPVGVPQMPIFDQATLEQSQEWIADLINVPVEQMTGFTEGIFGQPLVPEPSKHTQEMYAILDTVVQAVLTDENADIDALLADAQSQVQALIDADAAAAAAE